MADLCAQLAAWIDELRVDDRALEEKVRVLFVDSACLAVAARTTRSARALGSFDLARQGSCSRWDGLGPASALDATFVNALLAHARFQDDCEMISWTHPGSFVVPAALSGAEVAKGSFGALLRALVAGYAVCAWWGAEEKVAQRLMQRGMRCSPNLAPLAAAAAFAAAASRPADEIAAALSAAALMGRGALQAVGGGGDDWRWQNASGARDGVMCVLAAKDGAMRGANAALEGPNGFLKAYCDYTEIPQRWRSMPDARDILSVWTKAYPTLGDNMAPAVAACRAHAALGGRKVASARLAMNAHFANFPGTQRRPPYASTTEAVTAVRFAVALGLLHGDLTSEAYADITEPVAAELAARVEVVPGEELSYIEARLSVTLEDGAVIEIGPTDLPREMFFRVEAEASLAAERLLGPAGRAMAEAVFSAEPGDAAAAVAQRMLAANA